ncbi:type I CRISPR-associated protein Cas8a1/Csx8 [Clostridium estertheticum]|uniref:type I CRISPR-associated protein Cas8a1/Csx8 n=1 Tax=Clostridium estertheticum TaxID=238834 RepID=UPI001C0E8DDE|nr:type I CRISPR-associated protein Cas8a1/Csx8 [Clostridium estertheticum]MBU3218182.1 type I CRISPR-associated protein Cas8a1/Csx8 [Clostridium estertheticum]WAG55871.1 type I CRISPR-associated protein Cas8a1/Csx8 [Clostridium estertheticum]
MKSIIENKKFNTKMETSDWRYSASIVGIIKYFNYLVNKGEEVEADLYEIDEDVISYNSESITEERYLLFVEKYFESAMHHRVIEQIINSTEFTDDQIKLVNDKLKANVIMKKVFGEIKFSGNNNEIILQKINENRLLLIKETYRSGKSLYANFANTNSLFGEPRSICRIQNYNIDIGKKSRSISYNWDFRTYKSEDEMEFDFIPFAFSKSYEGFFINNNYSIKQLFGTNNLISISENPRSTLFCDMKNSANFIDFDAEVIIKNRDADYFETLYIRKDAIKIFQKIRNYKAIKIKYKVNDNYYMDFEKIVTNNILNNIKLDALIEILLKSKSSYTYNIKTLIEINTLIYGGDKMDKQMKSAYGSAKRVMKTIPENKVNSYKQKLISAITFKDYERFCEILLQLSSYSGVIFDFAYDLFEDFDENKNIAYTFINALNNESNKDNGGEKI